MSDRGDATTPPYSADLLRTYHQLKEASSKQEKETLMAKLAEQMYQEHDLSDPLLDEDYHEYFESYEKAKFELKQATLKVARLALQEIELTLEAVGTPIEDLLHKSSTYN